MATIVIDLVRDVARGQPDLLVSYRVEAAWRASPLAGPAVPNVAGILVAEFSGADEPVTVTIGRDDDAHAAFRLLPGERRRLGVRAGQRIEVLPASIVRFPRRERAGLTARSVPPARGAADATERTRSPSP